MIGDEIYFASDRGIATCLNARTGEEHWVQRIGKRFWASPLYADGKIFFFDTNGTTTVIEPGQKFKELSVNKLDGKMYATVAAVDGAIVLRTDKALYCIR
jgi:outer membrane protein assembly factor BamB